MPTFEETKSEVIKKLNATLNKESTKEQIDVVKSIEKGIEEMGNIHTKLNTDYEGVKDDYIQLMKESGTRKKPKEDGGGEETDEVDVNDVNAIGEDIDKYLEEHPSNDK